MPIPEKIPRKSLHPKSPNHGSLPKANIYGDHSPKQVAGKFSPYPLKY